MPYRVVLLPFPKAASFETLVSSLGGNAVPSTEDRLRRAKQKYDDLVSLITKNNHWVTLLNKRRITTNYLVSLLTEEGIPTKISALKSDPIDEMQEIGDALVTVKSVYDQAKRQRDDAIQQRWNKIDPQDVVCADSKTLRSALRKLKSADDALYIRGHCAAGQKTLESSDHTTQITVQDLINILEGKLPKVFPGKIKIFACESALDTADSRSFAKRFATSLSKQGWGNCTFYGYSEKLHTFIRDVNGHKTAVSGSRASESRVFIQVPTQHNPCAIL
jgi:hypothetical protein